MKPSPNNKTPWVRVYVDTIEEGRALLILEEANTDNSAGEFRVVRLPSSLLPAGTAEGHWVEFQIRPMVSPPSPFLRQENRKDDGKDITL